MSLFHFAIAIAQGVGAILLLGYGPEERMLVFLPFLGFQVIYAVAVIREARIRGLISPVR